MVIPDKETRHKVIELRRQQGLPLQFRLMDKNMPIPLTPQGYTLNQVSELKQMETTFRGEQAIIEKIKIEAQQKLLKENVRKNAENMKYGFYVLSDTEKEILKENGQDATFLFELIKSEHHHILFDLRKKVKYHQDRRLENIEVKQMFVPTQEAYDWALKDTKSLVDTIEGIVGKDMISDIHKEIVLATMHRKFHEGRQTKETIFGRDYENILIRLSAMLKEKHLYNESLWEPVLGHWVFGDNRYRNLLKTTRAKLETAKNFDKIFHSFRRPKPEPFIPYPQVEKKT